ncbi:glutathione S-transferase family protein [Patulibacter brassicae]|uniref:Glutathione S-transferase family protein n=1 Tax=Patulibacter brassicae TaxID=1705717 RepID=A0ABU4VEV4_9ACTN|nr:glutathione S-transferase family protein [Patulibacter brassicae]MDX8150323.1 glutathione S-transferase family protein [Patulibacter brassicae]
MADLRVYRIPWSTNVDRIAMAAAHKDLAVEWEDVDPDDRRPVRELSGQDLVPVAVDPQDGTVVSDSPRILRWIEERWPAPSLWPADPGDAALADVFCHRFNEVWKGPPNRIAALLGPVDFELDRLSAHDRRAVDDDAARMRRWLARFEERLAEHDHLGGDAFGICDVTAYPFLRFGRQAPAADDADPFHRVLHEHGRFDDASHPRLTAWVARVAQRPGAPR